MNTILWIGQAVLAAAFLYSGFCKSIFSEQQLIAQGQTGVAGQPAAVIRAIGISEVLGSIGIVVPWWIHTVSVLTPITAVCFAFVMCLAAPIHYRLKEPGNVGTNLFLLAIALLVAWGRFRQL